MTQTRTPTIIGERSELDAAKSEAALYAKTLMRLRHTLLGVVGDAEDEGDRIYFGSTNDFDRLKAVVKKIDDLAWDDIIADSQPPVDLYQIIADRTAEREEANERASLLQTAVLERAKERDEALKECAYYAREAGLATGKLEMSEAAGIVDGWRERAKRAENDLAKAQQRIAALTEALNAAKFYGNLSYHLRISGQNDGYCDAVDQINALLSQAGGEAS